MTKEIVLFTIVSFGFIPSFGQEEKQWSLQAGFGEIKMLENKYNEGNNFVSEDQGNVFYISADYWKTCRFAITGGLTFEQQGLFTSYSDGIGLKKINMLGILTGAGGNLEDQRGFFLNRCFHDTLDDLHVVYVEGADSIMAFVRFPEHFL